MTRQAAAELCTYCAILERIKGMHLSELMLGKDYLKRERSRHLVRRIAADLSKAVRVEEAQFAAGALEEFENEGGQNGNL